MAVFSVSVTLAMDEASRVAFQSEAAAQSCRKHPQMHSKSTLGGLSVREEPLPATILWPRTCTVGNGRFTGNPYPLVRPVSAPIAPSTEFKPPKGRLLGRVKGLLAGRGASQKSSGSESESEISAAVVVQDNMTAYLESKESFHSFETVQEYYPSSLEVPPEIEILASRGSYICDELSSPTVAEKDSTSFEQEMCRSMTIIQLEGSCKGGDCHVPSAYADSISANSREVDQQNYELNAPIISVGRKGSQKVYTELPLSTAIRKRGRTKGRGKVRIDRSRRMKPRALGRITPASGSEDSGKNAQLGSAEAAKSRLDVRFGRDAGMKSRPT